MSDTRRRWPIILLVTAAAVAVLAVGSGFLIHYLEREQWIVQTVDTQAIADARKLDGLGRVNASALISDKTRKDGCTLYNIMLYPSVRTAVCTVQIPEEFQEFAAYLVSKEGTIYPGWYNPASAGEDVSTVRYGIAKVAFENLGTTQLVRLDIVDQSEVAGAYTADSGASRISFDLTPPPPAPMGSSPASPESGSADEQEAG